MTKYGAIRTEVDGIVFASKAEARRYSELKLLEQFGEIIRLELQPRFDLIVNGVKIGRYTGDFRYIDLGRDKEVIEDVKSPARSRDYVLRKKLVKALYDIDIEEVPA